MCVKNFIVFEGIDGSGTSTQIKILKEKLGEKLFATAEPTTLPTGIFLRKLLSGKFHVDEKTASFLFAADRCEHVFGKGGILENIKNGKIVASDRYIFSTLAYQSVSCGKEIPYLLNSVFPLPEFLFYFKIPSEVSLSRVAKRNGLREIYEEQNLQKKIETEYDAVIESFRENKDGMKIIEIDANQTILEVEKKIWNVIKNLPMINL